MIDDKTGYIASLYKKLFRLPSTTFALFLVIVVSALISTVLFWSSFNIFCKVFFSLYFLITIIVISYIDYRLTSFSPISSFRRLLFASFFQLFPLIILSVCSAIFLYLGALSSEMFFNFYLLTAGYIFSIRFFLLFVIFYQSFSKVLIQSMLLPIPLYLPVIVLTKVSILTIILLFFSGIILLFSIICYIKYVDEVGLKLIGLSSFKLLLTYMQSWISSIPGELEKILEKHSVPLKIRTYNIEFNLNNSKISLIIPGVHPGPFAPIGSYNLPADLINFYNKKSVRSIVFHSPSSHAINLPSKNEVKHYLDSLLEENNFVISEDAVCTKPLRESKGKVTVTGFMLGKVLIMFLSMAPYGAEDFPREIVDYAKNFVDKKLIRDVIIIDSHNALGEPISESDLNNLKECIKSLVLNLCNMPKYQFKIGFINYDSPEFKEVGPGGISCLFFMISDESYVLYSIDSNNALNQLKLDLERELNKIKVSLLEICTTDSHFSSGKMGTAKGYYALGELSDYKTLIKKLTDLAVKASIETKSSSFKITYYLSDVKTLGQTQIDLYSNFLQIVLHHAKKGGIVIVLLSLLLFGSLLLTYY
ncbi:MAG: DUF2070 family protein [Nitrososphaeria archaeon]